MKNMMNCKLAGLTLTAALTLTALTACGGSGTAALPGTTPSATPLQTASASVGTVLLSVNPEIEMSYDEQGNVVSLTGLNDDGRAVLAGYTGYEGKPCKTVIAELVTAIDDGGYFDATIDGHEKNIVLKLERGSEYPDDDFLEDVKFGVFGLGSKAFKMFCECAHQLDERMEELGAERLVDCGEGNEKDPQQYKTAFEPWSKEAVEAFKED